MSENINSSADNITDANNKFVTCDICNKRLSSKTRLLKHYRTHSDERFKCEMCEKLYKDKTRLKEHLRVHKEGKPFKCEMCNKSYATKDAYKNHVMKHHDKRRFICKVCNKDYCVKASLDRHMLYHILDKKFLCNFCKKVFGEKLHLMEHTKTHAERAPFRCETCGFCYNTNEKLDNHMYLSHQNRKYGTLQWKRQFHCTICQKRFSDEVRFKQHEAFHIKVYCDKCNKSFSTKSLYEKHSYTHMSINPFVCHFCNKGFSKMRLLEVHHDAGHSGKKFSRCDICGRSCDLESEFANHKLTHTSLMPFECDICGKGIASENSGKKHFLAHLKKALEVVEYGSLSDTEEEDSSKQLDAINEFECEICQKFFYSQDLLEEHLIVHSEEMALECNEPQVILKENITTPSLHIKKELDLDAYEDLFYKQEGNST